MSCRESRVYLLGKPKKHLIDHPHMTTSLTLVVVVVQYLLALKFSVLLWPAERANAHTTLRPFSPQSLAYGNLAHLTHHLLAVTLGRVDFFCDPKPRLSQF